MHHDADLRPSLGTRICHSVSENVTAHAASAVAPTWKRMTRTSECWLIFAAVVRN